MSKILIIDDEAPVRKMLSKLLMRNGYDVLEAENGKKGIELYKEYDPALIITDLIMPEKEGLESIRELKKFDPDVQIIAISGGGIQTPRMYLDLASKFGAVRAFAKPIEDGILLSAIEEILS